MFTNLMYGIADCFESLFQILPAIGRAGNIIFTIIGAIGTVFWVWYMEKNKVRKS